MLGWVLFRSDTFGEAASYLAALFGGNPTTLYQPWRRFASNEVIWALCLGAAFSLPLWDAVKNTGVAIARFIPEPARPIYFGLGQILEIFLVVALLLISAAWLAGGTYNPFIYFRF
jgi:alginate O-acetyltransferase complex protein AlgI